MALDFNSRFVDENDGITAGFPEWSIFSNKKPTHPYFKGYLDNSLSRAFFFRRKSRPRNICIFSLRNITGYGKDNIELVFKAFEIILRDWENEKGMSLIEYFGNMHTNPRSQYVYSADRKRLMATILVE